MYTGTFIPSTAEAAGGTRAGAERIRQFVFKLFSHGRLATGFKVPLLTAARWSVGVARRSAPIINAANDQILGSCLLPRPQLCLRHCRRRDPGQVFAAWRLAEYADRSLNDQPQRGDNTAEDYRCDHVKYPGSPILVCFRHQHKRSLYRFDVQTFRAASVFGAAACGDARVFKCLPSAIVETRYFMDWRSPPWETAAEASPAEILRQVIGSRHHEASARCLQVRGRRQMMAAEMTAPVRAMDALGSSEFGCSLSSVITLKAMGSPLAWTHSHGALGLEQGKASSEKSICSFSKIGESME